MISVKTSLKPCWNKVKVMIGGAPITQIFADKIGADTFSPNAVDAVKQADKLTGRK